MNFSFFQFVFSPLVLGNASLLVMLTTRNTSLSERVRSATRLMNDDHPDMPALRRLNLLDQVGSFHQRYILNELALGALMCALISFLLMSVFASHKDLSIATVLFYCGIVGLGFGLILTAADVVRGIQTLDLEVMYAKGNYKPAPPHQAALKQHIAHRLQTDPEYALAVRDALQDLPKTPAPAETQAVHS